MSSEILCQPPPPLPAQRRASRGPARPAPHHSASSAVLYNAPGGQRARAGRERGGGRIIMPSIRSPLYAACPISTGVRDAACPLSTRGRGGGEVTFVPALDRREREGHEARRAQPVVLPRLERPLPAAVHGRVAPEADREPLARVARVRLEPLQLRVHLHHERGPTPGRRPGRPRAHPRGRAPPRPRRRLRGAERAARARAQRHFLTGRDVSG